MPHGGYRPGMVRQRCMASERHRSISLIRSVSTPTTSNAMAPLARVETWLGKKTRTNDRTSLCEGLGDFSGGNRAPCGARVIISK